MCAVFFSYFILFSVVSVFHTIALARALVLPMSFGSKIILSFLALLPKMSNTFQQQLLHEKCQQTHTLYTTHIPMLTIIF